MHNIFLSYSVEIKFYGSQLSFLIWTFLSFSVMLILRNISFFAVRFMRRTLLPNGLIRKNVTIRL